MYFINKFEAIIIQKDKVDQMDLTVLLKIVVQILSH
jgi:hypothetical protein